MSQNIYSILFFALCSIIVFYICPKRFRRIVVFISSFLFYALCDFKFVFLIFLETLISWILGIRISSLRIKNRTNKKLFVFTIIFEILILCVFKYFNFFINCFDLALTNILLPLGISYYTFRIISYITDIYLNKREAENSFINYSVYVTFFPHMICGPIVRSTTIIDKLYEGISFDSNRIYSGIVRIIYGLFMKSVVADRCGGYVNIVMSNPNDYPALALLIALCLYSIQLYCDFAGLSLIAQGITNCFGFDCISNFNRPYLASDIRDFWRRWHISLSTWLRDYIYIPMGGNRCKVWRKWINVLITFVVCGIWHGASLNFIIWGTYHGLLNNLTPRNKTSKKIGQLFIWFITLILVLFGWLLFRADSLNYIINYLKHIFTGFSLSYTNITASILPFTNNNSAIAYSMTLFIMILLLFIKEILDEKRNKKLLTTGNSIFEEITKTRYTLFWTSLFLILTILFGLTGSSNFLYANF